MIVVRSIVGVLAVAGVVAVLASVLRTVVLPRPVPARLARLAFLAVRALLRLRLRLTGRSDYRTRDRVFALQAPLGLFGQLFVWALLIFVCFAALFWSVSTSRISGASVATALEQSGSSMLTLGFDTPRGLARQLAAFTAAGVGLTLLALVITYLPSLYGAFSRREALVTKLVVRTGAPPSGPALLSRTWQLNRFEQRHPPTNAHRRPSELWTAAPAPEALTTFPRPRTSLPRRAGRPGLSPSEAREKERSEGKGAKRP